MKKGWILITLAAGLLLWGCTAEPTLETVADEWVQSVMAQPRQIQVDLPEGALAPVLDSDSEQVYLSDDYEIIVETLSAGDVNATVEHLSGYSRDNLTLMQTQQGDVDRYEFVWASTGEDGERLGRAVILDDGNYHYCMSVLRDADTTKTSQIVWSQVFDSFFLV